MDSILLFPPGASGVTGVGSAIQLGSWLHAEVGADYGAAGLIQSVQAQNALRDGGVFAYRHAPVRHMAIPLIINTPSVVQWEGMLARYTTPGAYIAVQPEGIPSSQAVYFDVIDGRWEPAYNTFENRAHVRRGTLHLDTQPYGYWPTEILLASAASIGFIGQLAVNGASVIGDVPPLAHIAIAPTVASNYAASTVNFIGVQWKPDMLAVSLGARPSFVAYLAATAWKGIAWTNANGGAFAPTLIGDLYAPGSQAMAWIGTTVASSWNLAGWTEIPTALEPAYRGRFRAFGVVKVSPSAAPAWQMIVDAERSMGSAVGPLASANQIASTAAVVQLGAAGSTPYLPTQLYQMLDLGEMTLPPGASGIQSSTRLRLWISGGASYVATPLAQPALAGLYLLPVDGAAGILTGGLVVPSLGLSIAGGPAGAQPTQGAAEFNQNWAEGILLTQGFPPPAAPYKDGRAQYRGVPLRLGASTTTLNFVTGDRLAAVVPGLGATYPVSQANLEYAQVSVSYRPAFQFMYGI